MLSAIVGDLLCLTQNESDLGEILTGTNQNSLKIKQKPSVTKYQFISDLHSSQKGYISMKFGSKNSKTHHNRMKSHKSFEYN
jgi:hypothetical protein